jgi:hypothetical protein
MKLVMVTTSHGHWDGLAGNTAMFSEAVVPATIVESLPKGIVETIFIKKNPQTRRFEKAWRGKTKNFKRVTRQDRDYILFEVMDLKTFNCPEALRTKTVGCHILTEHTEQAVPRRPIVEPTLTERPQPATQQEAEEKEILFSEKIKVKEQQETVHQNGHSKQPERELLFAEKPVIAEEPVAEKQAFMPPVHTTDIIEPGFFQAMLQTKDPAEFEQYCFYLLRILGIHDIHRPRNLAGTDAHGFFKLNSLAVLYITTLVPVVVQDNPMLIEHYLNLLKKEKMRLASTSYTIKDTQKQVWLLCHSGSGSQFLRTDDGIKLKVVPVSVLMDLYKKRMNEADMTMDGFWDILKNI